MVDIGATESFRRNFPPHRHRSVDVRAPCPPLGRPPARRVDLEGEAERRPWPRRHPPRTVAPPPVAGRGMDVVILGAVRTFARKALERRLKPIARPRQ